MDVLLCLVSPELRTHHTYIDNLEIYYRPYYLIRPTSVSWAPEPQYVWEIAQRPLLCRPRHDYAKLYDCLSNTLSSIRASEFCVHIEQPSAASITHLREL